jgi:hypothetical protein
MLVVDVVVFKLADVACVRLERAVFVALEVTGDILIVNGVLSPGRSVESTPVSGPA